MTAHLNCFFVLRRELFHGKNNLFSTLANLNTTFVSQVTQMASNGFTV
jgi:hypothetical protein